VNAPYIFGLQTGREFDWPGACFSVVDSVPFSYMPQAVRSNFPEEMWLAETQSNSMARMPVGWNAGEKSN